MSNPKRTVVFAALAFALSVCAFAQTWRVGASVGLVNDVENEFHLDGFHNQDVNGWVDYLVTDDKIAIRTTFGSMRTHGSQGGETVSLPGGGSIALPDLNDRIRYVTIGASYEYFEGDFTSGLFGGIGGYRVEPESVDPQFVPFQDPEQTVFGWHLGADASFRMVSRLSLIVRLTFHQLTEAPRRSLLNANAGFVYQF